MKLGPLNAAIRDQKGAVKIRFNLAGQYPIELDLQKGSLLSELKRIFPGGRGQETGLILLDTGHICQEEHRAFAENVLATQPITSETVVPPEGGITAENLHPPADIIEAETLPEEDPLDSMFG